MITQDNFKSFLLSLGFEQNGDVLSKHFSHTEGMLKVDFNKKELIYPEDHGLIINERQTCNFSQNENFVVFECVHRLLAKGYKPEHIELEPKWKVGHGASGGRADILVKYQQGKPMLIIECKTAGKEFEKAWKDIQNDGGQLFSYAQQIQETEFLCLYASSFLNDTCVFDYYVISHKDNQKIIADDINLLSFEKAKDVKGRFKVWQQTYQLEKTTKGIFEDNIPAYQIGKDKYTIDDLASINAKDKEKKYHVFRTILRKHNVSGRENAFDILVANPPFAVEDFLENLSEEQREKYEIFNPNSDLGNKNIQCFFIERAKQLLAPNGVAGIIVPSSVLSNSDNTHIATREILLKYFDIVSIVELGGNTFSKTGTNTVVLFLRRKSQRPEPAEQYENRVLDFFENWQDELESGGGMYRDIDSVKKYCEHIEVGFEDYQTLLLGIPSEQLLEYELFKEYKNEFDKSTEIVNLKKRKSFKDFSYLEQDAELNKRFLEYLQAIEKNKLYYFILAFNNPQKVLIVKSPADNKEQKQFLGYEWSNAKGNEGLKYLTGSHITPLFDPDNRYNSEKINYWIQQNFNVNSEDVELQNLSEYITYASLVDLLDFSRKDFNKAFSLTPKKNLKIETKWELVKLENVCEIVRGASPRPIDKYITTDKNGINWIKIGDVSEGSKYVTQTAEKITLEGAEKSRAVKEGDFILSNSMSFGRPYIMKISGCIHDGWLLLSKFSERLNKDYLYEILSYKDTQQQFLESAAGGVVQNLNTERVRATKIPLPPLEVQQQIVDECEATNQAVINAQDAIQQARNEITDKADNVYSKYKFVKLGSICEKPQYGANESAIDGDPLTDYRYIRITDINENGELNSDWRTSVNIEEKYILKEGDFLFARSGATVGKTFLYKNKYGKALYAGYLIRYRTNKDALLPDFLKLVTQSSFYKKWIADTQTGTSQPNINSQMYSDLQVPLPPLPVQEKLVSEVEKLEQEITKNQKIIDESPNLKQQVMKRYL